MAGEVPEWHWEGEKFHDYVKLLDDGRLEWGEWERVPHGGGGATYQDSREYLETRVPGYSWIEVPPEVHEALVAAIGAQRARRNR